MTVETKSHDAWFRSRVEEAPKDPRDTTPHSKVMHQVQTLIDENRREKSCPRTEVSYIHLDNPVRAAMIEAKIRKVGNSAVMTLSSEMLALLDAKEGDTLYTVRTNDGGLKLITENPELRAAPAAAEIVMDENRDLLHALA